MKPKSALRSFLLACSSLLAVSSAHALDGTWLGNGSAWNVTGAWSGGTIADGAAYTAFLTGVDIGAVTMALGANRTIGNITFTDATPASNNKLTISHTTGTTLTLDRTLGAVPVIDVTNQELEIASTLAGTNGLVKTGAGGLRLNGANNLTGGITIKNGGIASQNDNRFGTNLITIGDVANTVTSCSIQVTTTGPFSNNIDVRGTGTNLIQNYTAGSTWSGAINLGGNLTFNDRQNATTANVISGVISGTGNFSFMNRDNTVTQVLTLSNANTFSGKTTITSGILSLTHSNALQKSYIDTTASATGDANDGLRTNQTELRLGGLSGNKNLADIFTTTTGGYSSVTAITLDVATTNILDYSGAITGARRLTKTGAGTQKLSGANTFTGTNTVNAGTLELGANNTLGMTNNVVLAGGTLSAGNFNNSLGTLTLSGNSTIALGSGTLSFTNGAGTWAAYTLTLTNTLGATSLRFGTNSSGLSAQQLACIKYNEKPVFLNSNGYVYQQEGTLITFF